MFTIKSTNGKGARNAADYACYMMLNGVYWDVVNALHAAQQAEETDGTPGGIDAYNELMNETAEREAPVGLQQDFTKPSVWAGIYYALCAEIRTVCDDDYCMPRTPAEKWDALYGKDAKVGLSKKDKEKAQAVHLVTDVPVEAIEKGLLEAKRKANNQRMGLKEAVLDHLKTLGEEGHLSDIDNLKAAERVAMQERYIDGLTYEMQRMVDHGLLTSLPDGAATYMFLKDDAKEGQEELVTLRKTAVAAA